MMMVIRMDYRGGWYITKTPGLFHGHFYGHPSRLPLLLNE